MTKDNVIKFQRPKQKTPEKTSKRGFALYNEGVCFDRQDKDSIALEKYLLAEEYGYESVDMFSSIARIYGSLGQYEKVKEYASKAIEIDSEYGYPYLLFGGASYDLGEFDKALEYFLLAEKYEYEEVIMFRQVAELYHTIHGSQSFLKQLEYATKAIMLNPKNAYSKYWKGWIYYVNQEFSHALKYMLRAEQMGYFDSVLYYEISYCYSSLGNLDKAVEYANKCIFLDKKDSFGYYRKGFAYCMENDLAHAKEAFLIAENLECKEMDMYCRLGYIYFEEKNFDKAIFYTDKSIKLDKKCVDAYILKGNIYAAIKKDYKTCLKFYKKAYKLTQVGYNADFYHDFALTYNMLNRYAMAMKWVDEGLRNFPESYNLMAFKITLLQHKKSYDEASALTDKMVELYPDNIWNNYYQALKYYNCKKQNRDYAKIAEYLNKIQDSDVYIFGGSDAVLSIAYYELKVYKKSLEAMCNFFDTDICEEFLVKNKKVMKSYVKKLRKKFPTDEKLLAICKKYPMYFE